jgi:S-adenosylmethionine:tRNA ribosyltransferase-isomerase
MRTDEFDYSLPKELIAQQPAAERPSSRLLVLNRFDNRVEHRRFMDITEYLRAGDVLVVNSTKVIPARLDAVKKTGGRAEILLVEQTDTTTWRCLVTGLKRGNGGASVYVGNTEVRLKPDSPFWAAEFSEEDDARRLMKRFGRMPLPNYIKRPKDGGDHGDACRYQTVYATEEGSIAAPTAGLHFDEGLLGRIKAMGVGIVPVTLNIGVGTFTLIKSEELKDHAMHQEYYSVTAESLRIVKEAKALGGRVIAVGTSAVRTLESIWRASNGSSLAGHTNLFIYPGYRFKVVDALVTNFHLPRSTPLMLVAAFAGKEAIARAYREAIEQGYRFYSYGDSMFIS